MAKSPKKTAVKTKAPAATSMRVKMATSYASLYGQGYSAGKVYTFPIKEAEQLIQAGFAVPEHVCTLQTAVLRILEAGGTVESPPENQELLDAIAAATAAYEDGVTTRPLVDSDNDAVKAAEEAEKRLNDEIRKSKERAEADATETDKSGRGSDGKFTKNGG